MKVIKHILSGLLLAGLITGCGQTTVETMKIVNVSPNAPGKGMTALILPFADYSYADDLESSHRRNMAITESLTDQLVKNGFSMPVQEDVFHFLIDEKIIKLSAYDEGNTSSLSFELQDTDWSGSMRSKIQQYINIENAGKHQTVAASPGTHGLTRQAVMKIGRHFGADYVVRGRILEFKTRQEHTWAPWKRGIVPFVIGSTDQIAFGFAESDKYDEWGNMVAGGTYGSLIGYNVEGPWTRGSAHDAFLGSNGVGANTVLWGVVGAGLGKVARHSGKVDQAVVQMRIWIQDAYSGNVVWTNRIDVKVSPESVFAERQYDSLFNKAITQATTSLMNNFVENTL